jgi:hypothetical protein
VEAPLAYRPPAHSVITDPLDWWREARTAAVVAVFAALLGSVVGVIWHAAAPTVGILAAVNGSAAAMKPFVGDDVWLGFLGVIAGIVCVLVLVVVAPEASRGPGAQLGLAVGGLLGMLVAARIGHRIGHHHVVEALQAAFPRGNAAGIRSVASLLDFKVRATGVLLSWPVASVVLGAVTAWVHELRQPTATNRLPAPVNSTYSVSP